MALFDLGFPTAKPSAQAVASLDTQVAIARGTAQGIQKSAVNAAQTSMHGPIDTAESIIGPALQLANDAAGNAAIPQAAISAVGQQTALASLEQPFRTALALGYTPQTSAVLPYLQTTSATKRKGRQAKNKQSSIPPPPAQPQTALPQPIQKPPPGGGTPAATGGQWMAATVPGPFGGTVNVWGAVECFQAFNTPIQSVIGYYGTANEAQGASGNGAFIGPCASPATGTDGGPVPPAPIAPPIGGGPAPLGPPAGPVGGLVPGLGPVGQPGKLPPLAPPAPPSPSCCPTGNVNINIPPCPPNLIYIFTPQCPQCGGAGQLVPFPVSGPVPPGTPLQLPPTINLTVPPCPTCGAPQTDVTVNTPVNLAITVPEAQPAGGEPASTAGAPMSGAPSAAPAGPTQCPECSIPWLALNHPQFVIAERAARKTDYDILVDAVSLGICCAQLGPMPGCSMPLLEREMPDFVRAAKAQGLSDDQVLQSAVNIGLCSDLAVSTGLGEEAVGFIAPGSATQLAAEFDPSTSGEAGSGARIATPARTSGGGFTTGVSGFSDTAVAGRQVAGENCPPKLPFTLLGSILADYNAQAPACIVGIDRPIIAALEWIGQTLQKACSCEPGTLPKVLWDLADEIDREHEVVGALLSVPIRLLSWLARNVPCVITEVTSFIGNLAGCDSKDLAYLLIANFVLELVQKWTGAVPEQLRAAVRRATNYSCPVHTPSAAEANALRAIGQLTADEWECMVRRDGNIPQWQEKIVNAEQDAPTFDDVYLLERKGILKGEELAKAYQRARAGNPDWTAQLKAAKQWLPAPTDAIDWMIKDVQDAQIRQTFLTDAEFKQKYTGHVKEVFDWNAISLEDAQSIWRAHWRNMAPHELYQLHKRLRPGWTRRFSDAECLAFAQAICPRRPTIVTDADMAARPQSNGFPVPTYCEEVVSPKLARLWLESLVTDGYHVSEALGQADYPPFWRQRLLALSYNALNRTDLRTAYVQGSIDPARLLDGLLDIGYIQNDALALQRQDTFQAILKFTRNPVCGQYINYGGDPALMQLTLQAEGMALWMWPYVFFVIQLRRASRLLLLFIRSIQAQFMRGLLNEAAALAAMQNYQHPTITAPPSLAGFPALAALPGKIADEQLSALVKEWSLLKSIQPKQETAAQTCQEFKTGLITGRQAINQLVALNYTRQAAQRILSLCYLHEIPKTLQTMPKPGTKEYQQMQDALNS